MKIEVVTVHANQTVTDLIEKYAEGELSYAELNREFFNRNWSTTSLYENVRHIVPKKPKLSNEPPFSKAELDYRDE